VVISVVISSAKDADRTQQIVDSLHEMNPNVEVDVVVASPSFEIKRATNIHDRDVGGAERIGMNRPMARALKWTRGGYVAWLSDSTLPKLNCLEIMMAFLDEHPPPFIAEFFVGDEGGRCGFSPENEFLGHRDSIPFARWGMMSRKSIELIGFFSEDFTHQFSDIDLSLRCWKAGGSVKVCDAAKIEHRPIPPGSVIDSALQDREVFWEKWPELAQKHF
jgi:GT2 family glycosyltransferase